MIELIIGVIVGVTIILITHFFIKNYLCAGITGALICALANLLHEFLVNSSSIRPSDLVFWIPMLLIMSLVVLVPFSFLLAYLFSFIDVRKLTCRTMRVTRLQVVYDVDMAELH